MAADQDSEGRSFGHRREKWLRESAELRSTAGSAGGVPSSPEEAALRRYRTSTTPEVALPHPSISRHRYDALSRRHQGLRLRLAAGMLAVPLLVACGVMFDRGATRVAIWALLVPLVAVLVHHRRALDRLDNERHLTLQGGLASAWGDWIAARDQVEALEGASQARAALVANEARMQTLVLALGQAESHLGHRKTEEHRNTEEHRTSLDWVYRSAAKAVSLATAETELAAATRRDVAAGDLRLAPDGDLDALDHALDTARQLASREATGHTAETPRGLPDTG